MTVPVLDIRGLSVDFGVDRDWVPAVRDVSFSIDPGEVVALVGESGSGKSTASMTILDLLPSNTRVSGSIAFLGRELRGLAPAKLRSIRGEQIAAVFQEPMTALNPVLTVGFQLVETVRLHRRVSRREAQERALELLRLVELPDPRKAFDSYPHQLSGGQRQRAMIAQALSCDPQLLIADEPTTALDVTVQAEILELMHGLRHRIDSAILLITHDMGVVADLADRIVVMYRGEVVEHGPAEEIFYRPRHSYTQALLAAVPHLGDADDPERSIDAVAALSTVEGVEVEDAALAAAAAENERLAAQVAVEEAAADAGPAMLDFDDVVVEFGKRGKLGLFRAVDGVSLQLHEGEVLGLVGESGSGKTTLGRVAVGLQPVTSGSVTVSGLEIAGRDRRVLRELRRHVGIVFQDPSSSLNPRMPIGESIGEPILLAGQAKGRALQKRIEELLDAVNLPHAFRNRFPHELSGGQKQRVGIARAIALQPRLLVADEPTSALDVSVQTVVLELLKRLQQEMRFACLFISHDLAVVDVVADRIAVLHCGRVVEAGARDEILRAPKQPYTQRLLAAVPVPDPQVQRQRRALRRQILAHQSDDPGGVPEHER